jgi:hypothetical protein
MRAFFFVVRAHHRIFVNASASDEAIQSPSFRDGALAPDPESRDSGFDASHRPGMTALDASSLALAMTEAAIMAA